VVASTRPDYTAERLAELHTHLLDRLRLGGERATRALARDIEIGRRAVHKAADTCLPVRTPRNQAPDARPSRARTSPSVSIPNMQIYYKLLTN